MDQENTKNAGIPASLAAPNLDARTSNEMSADTQVLREYAAVYMHTHETMNRPEAAAMLHDNPEFYERLSYKFSRQQVGRMFNSAWKALDIRMKAAIEIAREVRPPRRAVWPPRPRRRLKPWPRRAQALVKYEADKDAIETLSGEARERMFLNMQSYLEAAAIQAHVGVPMRNKLLKAAEELQVQYKAELVAAEAEATRAEKDYNVFISVTLPSLMKEESAKLLHKEHVAKDKVAKLSGATDMVSALHGVIGATTEQEAELVKTKLELEKKRKADVAGGKKALAEHMKSGLAELQKNMLSGI